jgi:hypothetical protein
LSTLTLAEPTPAIRAVAPRARAVWPWVALAVLLPALALACHVKLRHAGDLTATYHIGHDFADRIGLTLYYDVFSLRDEPYDGQFFLALANDPFLLSFYDPVRFYRGRRIAFAWAGALLGLGRPAWIVYTLPLATLLLLGAAAWALARLLVENGRHPAWVLLHAASLGVAVCLMRELADAFAVNFLILGAFAWHRERRGVAAVLFLTACLAKETSVLAPAALAAECLWRRRRRDAAPLLLIPAVLALWWAWVYRHSNGFYVGPENLGPPLGGIVDSLRRPLPGYRPGETFSFWTMVGIMSFAALARPTDGWRWAVLAFTALAVFSTRKIWEDLWSYGRVHMTLPALLLLLYALRGRKADLAAPVAAAVAGVWLWWLAF